MDSTSRNFYNNFDTKLVQDYLKGNKRIESAIKNLSKFIPVDSKNILDIGCGIGWSSHEFARAFSNSKVTGVDLSPVLTGVAQKLFTLENLEFLNLDVTESFPKNNLYDAIIMIDVYEHIPFASRDVFHEFLKNHLSKNGKVVLACPSKFHQEWLRSNKPHGLQPIDEDVDVKTIIEMSNDINAELVLFEYVNIWNNYDYFYAVLEKKVLYGKPSCQANLILEEKNSRINRLNNRLGLCFPLPQRSNKIKKIITRVKKKLYNLI